MLQTSRGELVTHRNRRGERDVRDLTAQLLLDEYEVSEDIAREDAQATIDDWKELGIIV